MVVKVLKNSIAQRLRPGWFAYAPFGRLRLTSTELSWTRGRLNVPFVGPSSVTIPLIDVVTCEVHGWALVVSTRSGEYRWWVGGEGPLVGFSFDKRAKMWKAAIDEAKEAAVSTEA